MAITSITIVIVISSIYLVYCMKIPQLPNNPCPSVLHYLYDGQNWFASISVPSPPKSQWEARLLANFSVEGHFPNGSHLSIDDYDHSMDKIETGQPLTYTVQFARHTHIPRVTLIQLNNNIFCSGSPVSVSTFSWLTLTHNLYWFTNTPAKVIHTSTGPTSIGPRFKDIENTISYTTPTYNTKSITKKYGNNRKCGIITTPVISRIIGGEESPENSHPWLAALLDLSKRQSKPDFFCAGNLISAKHILTAAHCIHNKNMNQILIGLGVHNMTDLQSPEIQFRQISLAIAHPQYKNGAHADIAFILLSSEVELNSDIRPICLWSFHPDFAAIVGREGVIMGWGRQEQGEPSPRILETSLTITTRENCRRNPLYRDMITDQTFCAGRPGVSPCSGDSGGGFFLKMDKKWYLRGIISTAIGNSISHMCDVNSYSVYVDVAQYVDWISLNMELYP